MMKSHLNLHTGRRIGPGHPTYIIAEIGSNHDGSLDKAKRLIDMARQAGADAVKIQSFQVHQLINTQHRPNGKWEPHPAWDILNRLTVPEEWHAALQNHCKAQGIDFLSAPFDTERLDLLAKLNVPAIKIASGDLTYTDLLQATARTGIPVILSTGMAYLGEVETALNILRQAGCTKVALLHCVSLYPPSFQDMNIKAMVTMQRAFQVPVGFSDHTPGSTVPLGAVALGASIIEKHMTDDKTASGPDHPYALDVPEFTQMVTEIRQLEAALGSGLKEPAPGEHGERVGARRSLYATKAIPKGTPVTASMIKVVRHAYREGLPPEQLASLSGRIVARDIQPNELVTWDMFL